MEWEDGAKPGGVVKKLAWNAGTVKVHKLGQTLPFQKAGLEQHMSGEVVNDAEDARWCLSCVRVQFEDGSLKDEIPLIFK